MNALTTLVVEECCTCHMTFAMPSELRDRLLKKRGDPFYCPAGHRQWYTGKTEEQKLQEALARSERQVESARTQRDFWQDEADREKRRRAAAKGQLTKAKNRIARGVCPCCNRSFTALARHMATEHPDYSVPTE